MEHGLDARHLGYFQHDPIYRKCHQNDLTFADALSHSENFILAAVCTSEVVHGKASLIGRMPGGLAENSPVCGAARVSMAVPRKKLLFMGR